MYKIAEDRHGTREIILPAAATRVHLAIIARALLSRGHERANDPVENRAATKNRPWGR